MARSDNKSAKTVFQARGVEFHQQADTKTTHAEIGEKLGLVGGEKGGNGIDFRNDDVFDDDIGANAQWNRYLL